MKNLFDNLKLNFEDYEFLSLIKLSIFRAILDEVIPSMRAIYIAWKPGDKVAKIYFYHHGDINDAVQSHYSSIMAEVCGDCWKYKDELIDCDYDVVRLDYPNPLPRKGHTAVAYQRKEPFVDPE